MQVLKKYCLAVICLLIAGCSSSVSTRGGIGEGPARPSEGQDFFMNMGDMDYSANRNFRVGVLLPMSGKAAKHGQGMKNATMMALDDVNNSNLILQFYDTKSTPEGARTAIENAIGQRSQLIIGPLMSTEVEAVADTAINNNVPMIAFSSHEEVLRPGIYTLGLLVSEQVDRIISYAAANNRSRFALLLPDNSTGVAVAKAAVKSAQKNGVKVTKIGFYNPATMDFSDILKKMTGYNGKEATAVDFDAVLIPETGARLKSAVSMFAYYDVYSPQVQFLGTSIWENSNLNKESTLQNAWYPALSRSYGNYFINKYTSLFAERPNSLYSLAYDAIALSSALSHQQDNNLHLQITEPDGYAGINGSFRLFGDGTNQHSLDIMAIKPKGDVVIDSAPRKFQDSADEHLLQEVIITDNYRAPLIYGKDAATVQSLIYGQVLQPQNQPYH